jgi:hypothetical protein
VIAGKEVVGIGVDHHRTSVAVVYFAEEAYSDEGNATADVAIVDSQFDESPNDMQPHLALPTAILVIFILIASHDPYLHYLGLENQRQVKKHANDVQKLAKLLLLMFVAVDSPNCQDTSDTVHYAEKYQESFVFFAWAPVVIEVPHGEWDGQKEGKVDQSVVVSQLETCKRLCHFLLECCMLCHH